MFQEQTDDIDNSLTSISEIQLLQQFISNLIISTF